MESEHLDNTVPYEVRTLFDNFLVIGLGTTKRSDPDSVTILYLDREAKISASLCLQAMKDKKSGSFDGKFYDQNLAVGYYVVYGNQVDVLSIRTKRTKAFDEMYGNYMSMFRLHESGCSTFIHVFRDWMLDISEYHMKKEG